MTKKEAELAVAMFPQSEEQKKMLYEAVETLMIYAGDRGRKEVMKDFNLEDDSHE